MTSYLFSSLGKKYLMAITGIPLVLFVLGHMLGNLQIFLGPDVLNHYAETLQGLGKALWVIRGVLLVLFVAHIFLSANLAITNRAARPVGYNSTDTLVATLTSRTMIFSGILILAYLVYHIMHFTLQTTDPAFKELIDAQGRHDVYRMMIMGFSNIYVSCTYLLAVSLLAAHLHHGASSFFQSLGLNNPKYKCFTNIVGPVFAIVVFTGYALVPLSVLLGWVH